MRILSYTVEVVDLSSLREVKEVFAGDLTPKLEEAIMTLAEKLRTEGRAEGRAEGRQSLLAAQLRARFPHQLSSELEVRIQRGSLAEIDTWALRFATAKTIDEVFAD